MKRLWLAVAALLLLLAWTVGNARHLEELCRDGLDQVREARVMVRGGNWEGARAECLDLLDSWRERELYLRLVLRHGDIDQTLLTFREMWETLQLRQEEEFAAASARLCAQLALLAGSERVSWGNVL